MFDYVFIALFSSGQEREIIARAVSESSARNKVIESLTMDEIDNLESIDMVDVYA